jgi:hypothetical protein
MRSIPVNLCKKDSSFIAESGLSAADSNLMTKYSLNDNHEKR